LEGQNLSAKQRGTNVKFDASTGTTLAGNPAYHVTGTASIVVPPGLFSEETLNLEQKGLFIFTVKDQRLYTITYTGIGDRYMWESNPDGPALL
jgi:hypothetical protein